MNSKGEILLYQTKTGKPKLEVTIQEETVWLTQEQMAVLFSKAKSTINEHIKNIFEEGELEKSGATHKFGNSEFQQKAPYYYNLDVIISVGYRVKSQQGTQFRIWATQRLKEYIIKGFVMDDERLKQIKHFGQDYFNEMLERIREIRLSERRFYQKVTDIYALSADYDKNDMITKDFFATTQNKLHWAIQGKTAAEIIYTEADAEKIYMGLKSWKDSPNRKIFKSDVSIAKNYLNEGHLKQLERVVSAYLDLAENRASRGIVMNMKDWVLFLNKFLELSDYPILLDSGKISALEAKVRAEEEYDKFRVIQDKDYISDFDNEVKRIAGKNNEDK